MNLEIALKLLQIVLEIAPELVDWLHDLTSGKTDPVSLRVKDILPEQSASRAAQHQLGG
jgi:hypothetical protein